MSSDELLRVAVSQRVVCAPSHEERRDALAQDWTEMWDSLGVAPMLVPNTLRRCAPMLDFWKVEAVLLTGGNTPGAPGVDPGDDYAPERDRTERELIRYARAHDLPVVGVCRGAQMLDLYFGGRLRAVGDPAQHVGTIHPISLAPWVGVQTAEVNSFHRWTIDPDALPDVLVPFAWDAEGNVEAFHHRQESILGLMWHPERPGPAEPALAGILARALRGERFWPVSTASRTTSPGSSSRREIRP